MTPRSGAFDNRKYAHAGDLLPILFYWAVAETVRRASAQILIASTGWSLDSDDAPLVGTKTHWSWWNSDGRDQFTPDRWQ
jgi:hypothetical protein